MNSMMLESILYVAKQQGSYPTIHMSDKSTIPAKVVQYTEDMIVMETAFNHMYTYCLKSEVKRFSGCSEAFHKAVMQRYEELKEEKLKKDAAASTDS